MCLAGSHLFYFRVLFSHFCYSQKRYIAMPLKKDDVKEFAKMLFLDTDQKLSQKEIATRCHVRPNTVGKWIKDGGWERLRKSKLVTRQVMISDLYDQLEWLNDDIKARDIRVATSKESNTIAVLTSAIKKLETETSIAEVYEVSTGFLEYLKSIDFELHKKMLPYFDGFINSKIT